MIVYGGTPAGIAAAVQARRRSKSVIIVEPTAHIGGVMASGLTETGCASSPADAAG